MEQEERRAGPGPCKGSLPPYQVPTVNQETNVYHNVHIYRDRRQDVAQEMEEI